MEVAYENVFQRSLDYDRYSSTGKLFAENKSW